MKHLTAEAFERARHFIQTQARALERARFAHHFEGAGSEAVLAELAHFQNPDGGFGQALEPDLRNPGSSALASGMGLHLLYDLGCRADQPMVQRAVRYLLDTYQPNNQVWRVVPENTNDYPHAPWWQDDNDSLAQRFDFYRMIPRVHLVALLRCYASLVPAGWLEELSAVTLDSLLQAENLGEGGGSDLEYALFLLESRTLAPADQERLAARLGRALSQAVVRDPTQWDSYCLSPLKVVSSPQAFGADLLQAALQEHLDYQIEHQNPEGSWDPTWSWFGLYPQEWKQASLEWRGHLTLETLLCLRNFGRL